MIEFLNCFNKDTATLTLEGKTFSKKDCNLLGWGAEKRVYSSKGSEECFFMPRGGDERAWEALINTEKEISDELIAHGLKAQKYRKVPLRVQEPGGRSATINVLVTKRFDSVAKHESLVIYNPKGTNLKGDATRYIGEKFSLYHGSREHLNDIHWNQQIFKDLIADYTMAIAYQFPIPAVQHVDDSAHICLKIPKNNNEPPKARYMFWDVAGDYNPTPTPKVPTLSDIKKKLNSPIHEILSVFASNPNENYKQLGVTNRDDCTLVKNAIKAALTDEFLSGALPAVRKSVITSLKKQRKQYKDNVQNLTKIRQHELIFIMLKQAISTGNVECVKETLALSNNKGQLFKDHGKEIVDFARKYNDAAIMAFVNAQLSAHKVSNKKPEKPKVANSPIQKPQQKIKPKRRENTPAEPNSKLRQPEKPDHTITGLVSALIVVTLVAVGVGALYSVICGAFALAGLTYLNYLLSTRSQDDENNKQDQRVENAFDAHNSKTDNFEFFATFAPLSKLNKSNRLAIPLVETNEQTSRRVIRNTVF